MSYLNGGLAPSKLGSVDPLTLISHPPPFVNEENSLSTLPDPRSRKTSLAIDNAKLPALSTSTLDDEVATLSTKLIHAINHQTNLDDTLSTTRLELEQARARVCELEDQVAHQREMLAGDVWVRRKTIKAEKTELLSKVAEEKKAKQDLEKEKKKMEQELETLTAALFEEANKMVIAAKEETDTKLMAARAEAQRSHDALQRKNDQLRAQLAETDSLLRSQQEQLAELKLVMAQMSAERDGQASSTTPSTPGSTRFDPHDELSLSDGGSLAASLCEPASPSPPTSFTHLVHLVLRTDLSSFDDFLILVKTAQHYPSNRASSVSVSGLAPLGLGMESSLPASTTPSVSALGTPVPAPAPNLNPVTLVTTTGIASANAALAAPIPPLKDTKFYKRVLAEDIEPTLRLETAPGLSWLARRSVIAAMTDGSLVVEPSFQPQPCPCSLCGESRKDTKYHRTHRFQISESSSAQRYPLCNYCLARVRSTCELLGFLRQLKDGHRHVEGEEAEKAAWEESVRLREQMFWCRIGGGVLPAENLAVRNV